MKESLNKNLKLMVKTSAIVFIGLIISKILAYVYRVIIARQFGPEVYGLFSLALMILLWFVALSSFGLTDGLLRFIPIYRGKNEADKIRLITRKTSLIYLFSGVIAAILLFVASDFISLSIFHNPALGIFLKIFSLLIPINLFLNIYLSTIRAYEKISAYSFINNILQNVVKVGSLILFVYLGLKADSVIFSTFLALAVMLLFSYLFCRLKISEISVKSNLGGKAVFKEFFSYSWPIMFVSIVSYIFYSVDSFSIGYFKSAVEVGVYNAAVPIAMLLYFVPDLFMQLFFPLINKEYSANNKALIKELSQQVGKWIFLLNLPLLIIMIIFPGALINILFGSQYLAAENALRILAIGAFFYSMATISGNLVSMKGKSKIILANMVFFALLNLILNALLVPKYGINGAAFSTSLCYILWSIVLFAEAKHYAKIIPLRKKMIKILIISVIPTAIILLARQLISINLFSIILLGIIFIFLYAALIFMTGCLDKNDKMILTSIKGKLARLKSAIFTSNPIE